MSEEKPPRPPAATRAIAIADALAKAHKLGVEAAEGVDDGIVLVEGTAVALAVRRLLQLAQDMIDGAEDAPPVFEDKARPKLAAIIVECSEYFGVPMQQMMAPKRTAGLNYTARQAYFLIARRLHGSSRSYPQIARAIGLKDHSSAIHGLRTAQMRYESDRDFYQDVKEIENRLKSAGS